MKYFFLTFFFVIGVFMVWNGLTQDDPSNATVYITVIDTYLFLFCLIYCLLTYNEEKDQT